MNTERKHKRKKKCWFREQFLTREFFLHAAPFIFFYINCFHFDKTDVRWLSSFPRLVKTKHHFRKWLSQKSQWRHKKNKVKGSRFPAWKKLVSYHFFLFLCFLWPSVCFASQKLENRNTFKKRKSVCLCFLGTQKTFPFSQEWQQNAVCLFLSFALQKQQKKNYVVGQKRITN